MTAELLDAPDELYAVLAADPRAQLTVGQDAELTYGSDPAKIGKMRRVVVESVGDEVRVREGGKCRALRRPRILTLPRSVVYTRAEGAGCCSWPRRRGARRAWRSGSCAAACTSGALTAC